MRDYVEIESAFFPNCRSRIGVSLDGNADPNMPPIILTVYSGACHVQTYATRDELRRLAELMLRVANENEVLEVTG